MDEEENDRIIDELCDQYFYNEEEARAIPLGTKLVAADNKGQWSDATVIGHLEDKLHISWMGPWAKMKHKIHYDAAFSLSKCSTPAEGLHLIYNKFAGCGAPEPFGCSK